MVKEIVILAGGMGKRLDSIVKNIPKPMADIAGRPFLEYLLDYLITQSIKRVILAVGYKHEMIEKHFGRSYNGLELIYSVEDKPLGTGGAIKKALNLLEGDDFFISNGDTYFPIPLEQFYEFHKAKKASLSIALKPLKSCSRFGCIKLNPRGRIIGFREKGLKKEGLVNGGIYLLKKSVFRKLEINEKFSFEKDFVEKYFSVLNFFGLTFANYFFIDIGVPQDYIRAQKEMENGIREMQLNWNLMCVE